MTVFNGRPLQATGWFGFVFALMLIAIFAPQLHAQQALESETMQAEPNQSAKPAGETSSALPLHQDETNPQDFLKRAVEGFAAAQNLLGLRAEGSGDSATALKWYRKAAEKDYAPAQFSLGRMYGKGLEVEKDEREAVRWFRKAADQNNADGQNILGYMYSAGTPNT